MKVWLHSLVGRRTFRGTRRQDGQDVGREKRHRATIAHDETKPMERWIRCRSRTSHGPGGRGLLANPGVSAPTGVCKQTLATRRKSGNDSHRNETKPMARWIRRRPRKKAPCNNCSRRNEADGEMGKMRITNITRCNDPRHDETKPMARWVRLRSTKRVAPRYSRARRNKPDGKMGKEVNRSSERLLPRRIEANGNLGKGCMKEISL